LIVTEAETPVLVVVGGPIRNPIRMVGKCEQMRPKLNQGHTSVDWNTVVEHDFRKSITLSPREFLTYASLMFHSLGTVQSKTCVPVGIL